MATIDIVIPVYEGAEETRRCVESVLANPNAATIEIVVVDDASPNPAIVAYVESLRDSRKVTLLRNEANEGFVRSVNRGMALHPDRDVILLNSDTEVANDWVDRLAAAAHGPGKTATVTPFSNNATVCSYPYYGWEGDVPGTLGLAALDRLFAITHRGNVVDLPTAVGFCMFIRRDCLAQVGPFDAERFGRGYGEENDFSMRAAKAGWRNVLACDVFVFHEGSVSFSDQRHALMESGAKALLAAHPEYGGVVRDFIVADPVLPARVAIDHARARTSLEEAGAVIAERATERDSIHGQWRKLERAYAERESQVHRLEAGLAEATSLVHERTEQVASRDAALEQVRAGLAHAEELAHARERELLRIQSLPLWRHYHYLMGRFAPSQRPGP